MIDLAGLSSLYHCECFECASQFSSHPTTNVHGRGRWFTRAEWVEHRHQARNQALASRNLERIAEEYRNSTSTSVQKGLAAMPPAPSPLPSSRKRRRSPSPSASPPPRSAASSATQSPVRSRGKSLAPSRAHSAVEDEIYRELGQFVEELRPPESMFEGVHLYFLHPPHLHKSSPPQHVDALAFEKLSALDPNIPTNSPVIRYADTLRRAEVTSRNNASRRSTKIRLRSSILLRKTERYQTSLRAMLFNEWTRQYRVSRELNFVDSARFFRKDIELLPPDVLGVYLMMAALHLLTGTSLEDCALLLGSIAILIGFVAKKSSSIHSQSSYSSMLKTARPVLDLLNLHPEPHAYICCSQCYALHSIDPNRPSHFSAECPNVTVRGVCGAPLYRDQNTKHGISRVPVRQYLYQTPHEYLARLFSRPDLQDYLYRDPVESSVGPDVVSDVWQAPALRDFKFMDGTRFTKAPDGESRLIFSLNMDGLNPYGNQAAGKQVSIGAIYMVCLNLPPAIRHNPENVYLVGIMPGPKSPSKDEINHILRPLMDDFLVLWRSGIYLSRTHLRPFGIRVRCAIGPLICDLPASRQMSGFATYTSTYFCSVCKQTLPHINDLNASTWTRRTSQDHREHAALWREAKTRSAREKLVRTYGVKWSEMLRLPYWDPSRFTLIDSMHAFYLRIFQHHIREIWGMDVRFEDEDIAHEPFSRDPTEPEMEYATYVLRYGSIGMLKTLRPPVLQQLGRELDGTSAEGNESEVVDRLIEYRVRQGWFKSDGDLILEDIHEGILPPSPQARTEPTLSQAPPAPALALSQGGDTNFYFWNANKEMMTELRLQDLLLIFKTLVLPALSTPPSARDLDRWGEDRLRKQIQAERRRLGITNIRGELRSDRVTAHDSKTKILGRDTLEQVRRDIAGLNLPSWHSTGPAHPGEKSWGKFTAAQWRTFCIVNLPVTLIRLWGDSPDGSVQHLRLSNFIHLVTAVKLASMYTMDEDCIKQYEYHMHAYLTSLLQLYPGLNLTPYQHLSLHLGDQLRNFGPVHAWRCFVYERYNHLLQAIPTNQRFGDLEKTIFTKFCSAQYLGALYKDHSLLPQDLFPLVEQFNRRFNKDLQPKVALTLLDDNHFQLNDSVSWDESQLTELLPHYHTALKAWVQKVDPDCGDCPSRAFFRTTIRRFAVDFKTYDISTKDSHVSFQLDPSGKWLAGIILQLFTHTRTSRGSQLTQTFAIVAPYKDLPTGLQGRDLYLKHSTLTGRLVRNEINPDKYLIPFTYVNCHIATQPLRPSYLQIHEDCLLAIPLTKG